MAVPRESQLELMRGGFLEITLAKSKALRGLHCQQNRGQSSTPRISSPIGASNTKIGQRDILAKGTKESPPHCPNYGGTLEASEKQKVTMHFPREKPTMRQMLLLSREWNEHNSTLLSLTLVWNLSYGLILYTGKPIILDLPIIHVNQF
ncbi:hypothetical protein AMTR_s00069p00105500 [Amborella trichopoda]|uniref:Uncharacterized protein n=1 Tax=Amborella trichopoda TaxID=13333 RepID=U5DA07_AMBTC|nr:hypothetical protein AMTR_s00069p00105500 [Amborella trichopoda]